MNPFVEEEGVQSEVPRSSDEFELNLQLNLEDSSSSSSDKSSCYMAMPSRRPPQISMRMEGGALKHHQKQTQENVTEIDTKFIPKSDTK